MGHCRDNPSKLIWKYHFERKREIWRIVSYRSIRGRLASAQRQTKRCSCGRVNDAGHSSLRLSGQCCPLSAADGRSATKLKPRKSRSKPRPLCVTSRPSLQTTHSAIGPRLTFSFIYKDTMSVNSALRSKNMTWKTLRILKNWT